MLLWTYTTTGYSLVIILLSAHCNLVGIFATVQILNGSMSRSGARCPKLFRQSNQCSSDKMRSGLKNTRPSNPAAYQGVEQEQSAGVNE